MSILVVTQRFYPEQFRINEIVKQLVERGYAITVLTEYPNYPKGELYEGYGFDIPYETDYFGAKIVRLKSRPRHQGKFNLALNYLSFWIRGNRWVSKYGSKFDLTYCSLLSPVFMGFPCVKAKKKFKIPFIVNIQDMWPESFMCVMHLNNKFIYKVLESISNKVYKNADIVLCASVHFVEMLKHRNIDKDKLVYWPQFAEHIENREYSEPEEYKTRYRFVFTGNIGEAQGLRIILEVAKCLVNNEKIGIYIIGDGSKKSELEKTAREENLTNVCFLGRKPYNEIPAYLKYATMALLILKNNVLSETTVPAKLQMYMACGCPILCAIDGEARDIVEDADCGISCDYNKNDIVRVIEKAVCLREEQLKNYSLNGIKYAQSHFDKNKLLDVLEDYMARYAG